MHKPLISILMPAYNAEKYIARAIKSILKQTFSNFELIIVNDGSTDNTEKVILSFNDKRIKYYSKSNEGVARTLNYGLKLCKGKYVRRHDADDISTPNSLQVQIDFMKKHSEYQLVGTRIAYMTERGKIAFNYTNPSANFFNNKYFVEVTKDNYWKTRPIIHATVLAKTSLFEEVGFYRKQFPTSEDIDLWLRVLEKYPVAVINECNYFVRLHNTSNTMEHGNKNEFYRDLAYSFFQDRQKTGTDPLMRGEAMPKPPENKLNNNIDKQLAKKHKLFRNDILDYKYRIFVDAKDWKLVLKSIKTVLHDGWKLKQTWKAIVFPLLGEKIVKFGVRIKKRFPAEMIMKLVLRK